MLVYRIGSPDYIQDISGTGGLYYPGRWHRKGTRILYTSQAASLAKLEVLANYEVIPPGLKMAAIEVPDSLPLTNLDENVLPLNWRDFDPYPPELTDLAQAWLKDLAFLGLWVPSVHSTVERNLLLNPLHPNFNQVRILQITDVTFDRRLL